MKKILITIFILAITACSSKQEPPLMKVGISLTERAVNYALSGDEKMAEYTYNRALEQFRDMGKFCDMARVSFVLYSAEPYKDKSKIEDAAGFAILGYCRSEINIAAFLEGKPYSHKDLEEPFKTMADFKKTNNINVLLSAAKDSDVSDRIKSEFYRLAARHIIDENPKEAMKYVGEAAKMDSINGWTKNLLADEEIIYEAAKKLHTGINIIENRIEILKKTLKEKNGE